MICAWCTQEIEPGHMVFGGGLPVRPHHRDCLNERRAKAAREKWCPFAPGHPIACEDESRCIATDCMAWDGYDCRRLQIPEVE